MTAIADLLNKYKSGPAQDGKSYNEIEMRILVDERGYIPPFLKPCRLTQPDIIQLCRCLISTYSSVSTTIISQTMNFIQTSTNQIRQLVFIDGVQNKNAKKIYTKERLHKPVYIKGPLPQKLSISRETNIDISSAASSGYDICRSKLRISLLLNDYNWRIDITIVKNSNKNTSGAELRSIRDKLFGGKLTNDTFAANAPWECGDIIEIELEYTDINKPCTEEDLNIFDTIFNPCIKQFNALDADKNKVQSALRSISRLITSPNNKSTYKRHDSIKSLLPQVIELTKNIWYSQLALQPDKYIVTDKADGTRSLVHIFIKNSHVLMEIINDRIITVNIDSNAINADNHGGDGIQTLYLADCEYIKDNDESRCYIFDVMVFNGKNISNQPFEIRQPYIQQMTLLSPVLMAKQFEELADTKAIDKVYKAKGRSYDIDGLIFIQKGSPYLETTSYKWKPIDKLTIDFLVKKHPQHKELYYLFVGISRQQLVKLGLSYVDTYGKMFPFISGSDRNYLPIQFAPSDNPFAYQWKINSKQLIDALGTDTIDGEIIEMRINPDGGWIPYKIREDRRDNVVSGTYYGNNFMVAESLWYSAKYPLSYHMITSINKAVSNISYFKEHDVDIYRPVRSFNSFVKSQLFEKLHDAEWVIDLASGKGQDLFRYAAAGIKNVLFIEKDVDAIDELIRRKHAYLRGKEYTNIMRIFVLQADLTKPWKDIIALIKSANIPMPANGVMAIVCNMALHYFYRMNTVNLISGLLRKGGMFIYTAFNGRAVFNLLKENNNRWSIRRDTALIYDIQSKYKSKTFTGTGRLSIDVLLPFSAGEYYTETLINIDTMQKWFSKKHIKLVEYTSYADLLPKWQDEKKKSLTDADKQFISLYSYAIWN